MRRLFLEHLLAEAESPVRMGSRPTDADFASRFGTTGEAVRRERRRLANLLVALDLARWRGDDIELLDVPALRALVDREQSRQENAKRRRACRELLAIVRAAAGAANTARICPAPASWEVAGRTGATHSAVHAAIAELTRLGLVHRTRRPPALDFPDVAALQRHVERLEP